MVSKLILTVASMLGLGLANGPGLAASSTIPGTGAVTGTVTAAQPFSAAHVYLYNAEKRVTYMVYSAGGRYQAINLYPGQYEVRAARRGLVADPQKITVRAGETVNLDVALKDIGPAPQAGINGPSTVVAYPGRLTIVDEEVEFVRGYDTVYPPGPGRQVLERVCMSCHGTTFISMKQWDRATWSAAIDTMSKRVDGMDTSVPNGKMSPKDRQLLLDMS